MEFDEFTELDEVSNNLVLEIDTNQSMLKNHQINLKHLHLFFYLLFEAHPWVDVPQICIPSL